MNFYVKRLILLAAIFALASTSVAVAASNPRRFHYMGTPVFNMPTGYVRSSMCYINDAGHSAALFSQGLLNQFLEVSYL